MTVQFQEKFESLPETMQQEALQFIDFLLFKKNGGQENQKALPANDNQKKNGKKELPERKEGIPAVSFAEWTGSTPDPEKFKPGFGCLKGMISMAPDLDDPLEDFKEYMY